MKKVNFLNIFIAGLTFQTFAHADQVALEFCRLPEERIDGIFNGMPIPNPLDTEYLQNQGFSESGYGRVQCYGDNNHSYPVFHSVQLKTYFRIFLFDQCSKIVESIRNHPEEAFVFFVDPALRKVIRVKRNPHRICDRNGNITDLSEPKTQLE